MWLCWAIYRSPPEMRCPTKEARIWRGCGGHRPIHQPPLPLFSAALPCVGGSSPSQTRCLCSFPHFFLPPGLFCCHAIPLCCGLCTPVSPSSFLSSSQPLWVSLELNAHPWKLCSMVCAHPLSRVRLLFAHMCVPCSVQSLSWPVISQQLQGRSRQANQDAFIKPDIKETCKKCRKMLYFSLVIACHFSYKILFVVPYNRLILSIKRQSRVSNMCLLVSGF